MSSKTSTNGIRQLVEKVTSSQILQKHDELKEIISGPLKIAREKSDILESNEALTVLSRIDEDYIFDLKQTVGGIFYEELERANQILEDIDSILKELQDILDTTAQRISNEKRKSQDVSLVASLYEDARRILVFLKLKTNLFRARLEVSLEEPPVNSNSDIALEIDEGDFLFALSKLETSCRLLED